MDGEHDLVLARDPLVLAQSRPMSLYLVIVAFMLALAALNLYFRQNPPTEEQKEEIEAVRQAYQ